MGNPRLPLPAITLSQIWGRQIRATKPLRPELRQRLDTNPVLDFHPSARILPGALDSLLFDAAHLCLVTLEDYAEGGLAILCRRNLACTERQEGAQISQQNWRGRLYFDGAVGG